MMIAELRAKPRDQVITDREQKKAMIRDLGPLTSSKRIRMILDDDDEYPVMTYLQTFLHILKKVQAHVVHKAKSLLQDKQKEQERQQKYLNEMNRPNAEPAPLPAIIPPVPGDITPTSTLRHPHILKTTPTTSFVHAHPHLLCQNYTRTYLLIDLDLLVTLTCHQQ